MVCLPDSAVLWYKCNANEFDYNECKLINKLKNNNEKTTLMLI